VSEPAPNLIAVARRAKVSISTVSRTINQTGKISAATQEHVRRVMREMGYRPNRVARRLRAGGKCHLLGLIIPNIQNPFFADVARGVEDVAFRNNFALLLCNYDEDPAKERFYLEVMQAESVDGIVLPPIHERDPAVLKVARSGIPIVCVDRALADPGIDTVEIDNERGAFEAVSHLIAQGHSQIGLICGPADSSTGRERHDGYVRALKSAGIPVNRKLVRFGDYKQASGRALAEELLQGPARPSALFVCNNLMTIGALEVIGARRMRMPHDVALVGFDDLPLAAVFEPPLTVVRQPAYEVGRSAAELLLRRIEEPGRPPSRLRLLPDLVVRGSG
jgi:LacI family transcriptional regulator